jgi:hypothetical protein
LASIAAHASSQFLIAKETLKGRTRTLIRPLAKDERPREIARMLGESQSKAALLLAEELLERAQKGSSSSTPKKTAAPVAKAKSAAPAKASAKDNGKKKIASAKPVRRARDAEA